MKFKIEENRAGVITLKNGTTKNCGTIRVTRNRTKLVHYTGMGLRELFKPNMTEEEKIKASEIKKLDEKELMKLGYIEETLLDDIKEIN